jgi:hypothetical protein
MHIQPGSANAFHAHCTTEGDVLICLTHDRHGYLLTMSDDEARLVYALICQARPRGAAECAGIRVEIHGPSAADPLPEHVPVDGMTVPK